MKLLVIDTSTSAFSVALTDNGTLAAEFIMNRGAGHSSGIIRAVGLVMESGGMTVDSLDGIGVTLGPGSFTGLRVGLATVKGLALATGKPVAGFSSLAMLAMNLPHAAFPVCPMFDARKSEVYTALYRCTGLPEALIVDCVASPADFLEKIGEPTLFVGSGAVRYRDLIVERLGDAALFPPEVFHPPRASAGAVIAADLFSRGELLNAADMAPVYIRPSEAELSARKMRTGP